MLLFMSKIIIYCSVVFINKDDDDKLYKSVQLKCNISRKITNTVI